MMRIPFLQERRQGRALAVRRWARDLGPLTETLSWAGASFFLGYLFLAAALGIFAP